MTLLWVAVGGAVGAPLRYLLGRAVDGRGPAWHPGTLAANTGASLLLGACVGWSLGGSAAALVATGFCGGLSTYSSLAVQARDLGPRAGGVYAAVTIVAGLAACSLGFLATSG